MGSQDYKGSFGFVVGVSWVSPAALVPGLTNLCTAHCSRVLASFHPYNASNLKRLIGFVLEFLPGGCAGLVMKSGLGFRKVVEPN